MCIFALCDGQESCQFENAGTFLEKCWGDVSDYMQLFYDCLPDDETGPGEFTAWTNNTGCSTSYSAGDIIVVNEVLPNAGGQYNAATSSFVCPWDGIYLMSVHLTLGINHGTNIDLWRSNVYLANIRLIDSISDVYNRGGTTIATECELRPRRHLLGVNRNGCNRLRQWRI